MANRPPYRRISSYEDEEANQESIIDGVNKALASGFDSFGRNSINLQKNSNIQIKQIDVVVPSPWIPITTFLNGWVNFAGGPAAQYMRRYDGTVELRGKISTGAIGASAFTLPQELFPHVNIEKATVSNALFGSLVINTAGAVIPTVGSNVSFSLATDFMPANNRHTPQQCYPINVKTRFYRPPAAVLIAKNTRIAQDGYSNPNVALLPSWRFIMANGSPTVQILDIPGLEYGCRQKVSVIILGE